MRKENGGLLMKLLENPESLVSHCQNTYRLGKKIIYEKQRIADEFNNFFCLCGIEPSKKKSLLIISLQFRT